MKKLLILSLLIGFNSLTSNGQKIAKDKKEIIAALDSKEPIYANTALKIWEKAEIGYQEFESCVLLQDLLKADGFSIQTGVADIPTSFIASYGSGKPVISVLAEYDALPGVSQEAVPYLKEREDGNLSGHACGHHLFGTGAVAAAIEVKNWLLKTGHQGTIRVYGTPAEEGGSGKVYMAREGLFDDVDASLYWHPGNENSVRVASNLAIASVKFRFKGISTHAAGAPEKGRSALDGVEVMDYMMNMMREHVPSESRIHYVITKGGEAPNVVPANAEVYYFFRHPDMRTVKDILDRSILAAQGAALGTGTIMSYEMTGGSFNILPNAILSEVMHKNLTLVGGVTYTEEEHTFAEKIMTTYNSEDLLPEMASKVEPFVTSEIAGNYSTDAGDVSWIVPLVSMSAATWPPGTPGHSWQAVAAGGTTLGIKGMTVASKTMAMTIIDLFNDPTLIEKAKIELNRRRGDNFKYEPIIGDRAPALDYAGNH
ncbi:MAG: amidohydrolase [Flammeovirgaceae bacterium]|jgi:aminobenzoyl-glutamate utilization protein B|nr:amidohydrolase [Flammeovirgaceae bacterium]|tara:strand:- start:28397 stop:29848 length:1452 start_codon:yes stop_codon:yes gene_type:complete